MTERSPSADPVAWAVRRIAETYEPRADTFDAWLTAAEALCDAALALVTDAGQLDPVADALARLLGAVRQCFDPLREMRDGGNP